MIFAGNGIRLSKAERPSAIDSRSRCRSWRPGARPIISSEDRLCRPARVGRVARSSRAQNCDFLLTIGVRLDFAITGFAPDKLARAAHKVASTSTPRSSRSSPASSRRSGDAKPFIRRSSRGAGRAESIAPTDRRCTAGRRATHRDERAPRSSTRVSVYHLAEVIGTEVARRRDDDVQLGERDGIFLLAYPARTGQRRSTRPASARCRLRHPAAIAARANDRRRTICVRPTAVPVQHPELETVSRLKLPITS